MSDLSQSLEAIADAPLQGALVSAEPEIAIIHDPNAVNKARYVIRQLKAAGLKTPFDFDVEEASVLWSTQIGMFNSSVLDDSIKEWITDSGQEFPSVGDFAGTCQYIVTERMRFAAETEAKNDGLCSECGGVRWVRIEIPAAKRKSGMADHTMRPCSLCPEMKKRYDLHMRGHFDAEHLIQFPRGCRECREYHDPPKKGRRAS